VTFTTDAYAGDLFSGTVSEVRLQPVVTQNVVTYTTSSPCRTLARSSSRAWDGDGGDRVGASIRHVAGSGRSHSIQTAAELTGATGAAGAKGAQGAQGAQGLSAVAARAAKADATASARAVVWQVVDGTLKPVRVMVAISDGTEVAVTSDALQAGMQVATS
jgi:HlyD family secretion protein